MPQRDGTTDLLPICTVCRIRMARSGRALRELRENPRVYDGWTHRACRNGSIRPNATQRAAAQPAQSSEETKPNITLDAAQGNKTIDLKKYKDMFIGLEIESDASTTEIKRALDYKYAIGHNSGKVRQNINEGDLSVTITKNLYKEADFITDVYDDGSIGAEVVTRPVRVADFDKIKDIHKKIIAEGDCYAGGRGGCHMTFLNNHHQELSDFDKIVAKNMIQFARIFYKDLVLAFGVGNVNTTRGLRYRAIPEFAHVSGLNTEHYTAISLRKTGDRIWGIEIRFPDGNNDFEALRKQALFWSSVFLKVAKISKHGMMNFDQAHWLKMKAFANSYAASHTARGLSQRLKTLLDAELKEVGYYDEPMTDALYNQERADIINVLKGE